VLQSGSCELLQPPPPLRSSQIVCEQKTVWHDSVPSQVTSHAHELPHMTPRHELVPSHWTSHVVVPQFTWRQLPWPVHVTLHEAESLQSTSLHEPPGAQLIWQLNPGGQVTVFAQLAVALEHVILQVIEPRSHDVQIDGQVS
jgi:hypothetical protein